MASVVVGNSKKFSVVEFVDENVVEAIPSCWVDDLNNSAWWPSGQTASQLSKSITHCAEPNHLIGDNFLIRVLGRAGM